MERERKLNQGVNTLNEKKNSYKKYWPVNTHQRGRRRRRRSKCCHSLILLVHRSKEELEIFKALQTFWKEEDEQPTALVWTSARIYKYNDVELTRLNQFFLVTNLHFVASQLFLVVRMAHSMEFHLALL